MQKSSKYVPSYLQLKSNTYLFSRKVLIQESVPNEITKKMN